MTDPIYQHLFFSSKYHQLEGLLYPNYSDPTNVKLDITGGCFDKTNLSDCKMEETGMPCPTVKLCCVYEGMWTAMHKIYK